MNFRRQKRLAKAADALHEATKVVDEVLAELRAQFDNMPSGRQCGASGDALDAEIADMEEICSELDSSITRINELAGTQ